jgi:hypothetical protein
MCVGCDRDRLLWPGSRCDQIQGSARSRRRSLIIMVSGEEDDGQAPEEALCATPAPAPGCESGGELICAHGEIEKAADLPLHGVTGPGGIPAGTGL